MVGRRVEVTMMGAKPEEASQEPKLDLDQIKAVMAVSGLFWQVCVERLHKTATKAFRFRGWFMLNRQQIQSRTSKQ